MCFLHAYRCGRWLLCSHWWSSYSGSYSMTACIYRHVRSDWENTCEINRKEIYTRKKGFPLSKVDYKVSKKIHKNRITWLSEHLFCWEDLNTGYSKLKVSLLPCGRITIQTILDRWKLRYPAYICEHLFFSE